MSGTSRGVAAGVAQGAENFYKNFIAARQFKEQMKYKKLEPVIGVIMSHISSPDITMDERIAAIDSLPHILGIKDKGVPLSKQLGLDKFAEQMAETGDTQSKVAQTGTVKKKALISPVIGIDGQQIGEQQSPAMESPVFGTKETPVLQRRGSLSDTDIKFAKQLKLVSHNRLADFDMEKQKLILQAELQDRVLVKQGWEKDGDWVLDTVNKTWQRQWTNPRSKETFMQTLPPDVVPESIIKEREKNKGGGKDSIIIRGLTDFYTSQGNDQETARGLALTDFHDNYKAGTDFKKQGVQGTRATDTRADEGLKLQKLGIQQKHSELVASASASESNVASLAKRKSGAWADATNALEDFKKAKEEYEPDEKEYQAAQSAYTRAMDRANDLETEYQTAAKAHTKLTEQVKLSEENLKASGVGGVNQTLTPKQKAYVDKHFGGDVQKAIEYNQSKGKVFP